MNSQTLLADRLQHMGASAIREILKVVSRPGMISLAGGIPSPQSFPMDIIGELTATVFTKYSTSALQYDPTEGFPPLRLALAKYLTQKGIATDPDQVLVASGSQGVLDAVGKVLISKGDEVAVEAPTYLGALQAFDPYQPRYVSLDTDDEGVIPESLEAILTSRKIKLIYLVPTFQNPTGRTIPLHRRRAIAEIIQRHDALLVEDDPYGDLRFSGAAVPPLKTLAPEHVIYIGTFSKIFAPGLRVGYCLAPREVSDWLVIVKQGVDLHTSTLSQALAAEYLSGGHLDRHLPHIIDLYRPKLNAMLDALAYYFPPRFKWSQPEGGMFLWAVGPPAFDAQKAYYQAIEKQVAFVPGRYFYADPDQGTETMRLNFTMSDERTIERGIQVLSEVIATMS